MHSCTRIRFSISTLWSGSLVGLDLDHHQGWHLKVHSHVMSTLTFFFDLCSPFLKMQMVSVNTITCYHRNYSWCLTQTQTQTLRVNMTLRSGLDYDPDSDRYKYRYRCTGPMGKAIYPDRLFHFLSYSNWLWWLVSNGIAVTFKVEFPFMLL